MNLSLDVGAQKLINERVRSGKYATPEEVVTAALHALAHDERAGDFAEGEWDALLAEGEASGEAMDGESVLAELRGLRERHQPPPDKAG
jgi:Arc/MetJ-type ribon-helix-helix transcriptional regulator